MEEGAGQVVLSEKQASQFVAEEDEEGEGEGGDPPVRVQRINSQILREDGTVEEEYCEQGFKNQGKV